MTRAERRKKAIKDFKDNRTSWQYFRRHADLIVDGKGKKTWIQLGVEILLELLKEVQHKNR